MSWKVHDTDDVFAALRGLCSNSYRMYDPSEYRYYYCHDCETYERAVEDAAGEYERLLRHCNHQRQELAKLHHPIEGEVMNERTKTEQGSSRFEQGSNITDELREYVAEQCSYLRGAKCSGYNKMLEIADRIDAEHERLMQEQPFTVDMVPMTDERMAEHGWIRLPVDADGVPIHMGDEMELTDEAARRWDGDKHFGRVMGLELTLDGWTVEGDPATDLRHVKPDSWERILMDMVQLGHDDDPSNIDLGKYVERCRRLAGE